MGNATQTQTTWIDARDVRPGMVVWNPYWNPYGGSKWRLDVREVRERDGVIEFGLADGRTGRFRPTSSLRLVRAPPPQARAGAGPFETEQEARELPAVRAIYGAMNASHRRGVIAERNHRLLDEACAAAGVELGAYDHRILTWLAGFEPQMCAVFAGIIIRAAKAGGR